MHPSWTDQFTPPRPFRSHPIFRGGHLQTLAVTLYRRPLSLKKAQRHLVDLPDGDQLVLHENTPPDWQPNEPTLLIVHGLCGCHQAGYMLRLMERFVSRRVRVFRIDMRGCGAGAELAAGLNHAGRSADLASALNHIMAITDSSYQRQDGPLWLIGISLGAAQSLKLLGELPASNQESALAQRLQRAAVVAPPADLLACSQHMQRLHLRPYNRYFIRSLLSQAPAKLRQTPQWQAIDLRRRPRTLFELDDRVTAPLSGFAGALDYYQQCSAIHRAEKITCETLVLAAADDPIIPLRTLTNVAWSASTHLQIARGGGHVAFLQRGPQRFWMDEQLERWFFG